MSADDDILGEDLLEDLSEPTPVKSNPDKSKADEEEDLLDYGEDLLGGEVGNGGEEIDAEQLLLETEAELGKEAPSSIKTTPKRKLEETEASGKKGENGKEKKEEKEEGEEGEEEEEEEEGEERGESRKRGRFEKERRDNLDSEDGEIPQGGSGTRVPRPGHLNPRPSGPRPFRPYPSRPYQPNAFPMPLRPYAPFHSHNLTLHSNKYVNPQYAAQTQRPGTAAQTARPPSFPSTLNANAPVFRPQLNPAIPHLASLQSPSSSFASRPTSQPTLVLQPPGAPVRRNVPIPIPVVNRNPPTQVHSGASGAGGGKQEVVVSNVGPNITEQSLSNLLSAAGPIVSITFDRGASTAHVKFGNANAAVVCRRKFNRSMFEGSQINVAFPT